MCGVGIWTVHGVEIWTGRGVEIRTVCGVCLQYCRHQNLLMVEQLWEQEDNPSEMAYTKIVRSYGEDVSHLSPTFFLSIHTFTVRHTPELNWSLHLLHHIPVWSATGKQRT